MIKLINLHQRLFWLSGYLNEIGVMEYHSKCPVLDQREPIRRKQAKTICMHTQTHIPRGGSEASMRSKTKTRQQAKLLSHPVWPMKHRAIRDQWVGVKTGYKICSVTSPRGPRGIWERALVKIGLKGQITTKAATSREPSNGNFQRAEPIQPGCDRIRVIRLKRGYTMLG